MSNESETLVITGCGWVTPYAAGNIAHVLTAERPEPDCPGGYWAIADTLMENLDATGELKQDRGARVAALALHLARSDAGLAETAWDGARTGLILGCGLAGQMGMIQFADEVRAQSPRFVSPIHFPQTVGNYIAGALSRACDLRGPNLTLAGRIGSGLDAVAEGARILRAGDADLMIVGGAEVLSPAMARTFDPDPLPLSEGACMFVIESAANAAARNRRILAEICDEHPPAHEARQPDLISAARHDLKHAVTIGAWIGLSFGTLGAAAIAAAIGTAQGLPVPMEGRPEPTSPPLPDRACHARIVAEAHNASLFIDVPASAD